MTDFCLGPQTLKRVARQTELMSRMLARLGVEPARDRGEASMGWYEARLRCIACRWSGRCAGFLAEAPRVASPHAPEFCANAGFYRERSGGIAQRKS